MNFENVFWIFDMTLTANYTISLSLYNKITINIKMSSFHNFKKLPKVSYSEKYKF